MDTPKEFEILVRRKIPLLTNLLYGLTIFLLSFLFILYIVMYPAIHSQASNEMQMAYYITVVPESVKVLSSYSVIGLLIVVPLYYRARLQKPGIVRFEKFNLLITGGRVNANIPKSQIKKVYFNDLKNAFGVPKGKLQVVIDHGAFNEISFRLKNYAEGGELIDAFGTLDNVVLTGYDREMIGVHDDDD